tara:strand:- start:689 stop:1774 length:1086 start_codon:yes stop_codon:yes gene_type:complete
MDSILATIILPPSRNLLTLLDFCYAITLIIYLPFFAMTVGSLTLSVFYRLISDGNPARKEFAREILLQIFPERHYGILYGAVPVFTVIVVYAQSLYKADIHVVGFMIWGIVTTFAGYYFFYRYRSSLREEHLLEQIQNLDNVPVGLAEQIEARKSTVKYTLSWMMIFAPVFMYWAAYLLIGAMEVVLHPSQWAKTFSAWQFLIFAGFWWKFLFFLSACFAISGAGVLFYMCKQYDKLSDEGYELSKVCGSVCGLYGSALLPVLGLFYGFTISKAAYSDTYVHFTLGALFFLFFAVARLATAARSAHRRGGSTTAFALLIIVFSLTSMGDTVAKKSATYEHTESVLSVQVADKPKTESNESY